MKLKRLSDGVVQEFSSQEAKILLARKNEFEEVAEESEKKSESKNAKANKN
jgi:serine/threonine protein phosphatase PrpC